MFTSWSEVSTPAELSMASVLMPARRCCAHSMRPSWVKPEVAALADDPARAARARRRGPRRWPCRPTSALDSFDALT